MKEYNLDLAATVSAATERTNEMLPSFFLLFAPLVGCDGYPVCDGISMKLVSSGKLQEGH